MERKSELLSMDDKQIIRSCLANGIDRIELSIKINKAQGNEADLKYNKKILYAMNRLYKIACDVDTDMIFIGKIRSGGRWNYGKR